jgi:hypothetical protein
LGKKEVAEAFEGIDVNIHCARGQLFIIFQVIEVSVGRLTGNVYRRFAQPVLKLLYRLDVIADGSFGKSFQLKERDKLVA